SGTENDSSISRSSVRSENGRRQSTRPSRNSPQKPSQIGMLLIRSPPNAPFTPRAIVHATWGPTHDSVTNPNGSSTFPVAISPAFPDQTETVHEPSVNVASVVGSGG